MADLIQIRRDTKANWASKNPVLALGEPGLETDTRKMKYGNGSTTWNNLPYSGGAGGAFDISEANNGATYETLASALAAIPVSERNGGMSIKFINTTTNSYVHYRYVAVSVNDSIFLSLNNWQGVDEAPTSNSKNLVESGGVYTVLETQNEAIARLNGNAVVVVENHLEVQNPDENKIYREQGTDSYTDWMYTDGEWKDIATYAFPGIDNYPKEDSEKFVKSGGIHKAISDAKSELVGNASNDYNTLGKIEDEIKRNEEERDEEIENLIGDADVDYDTLGKIENKIKEETLNRDSAIDELKDGASPDCDTLKKLERQINLETQNRIEHIAESEESLKGGATPDGDTLKKLENRINAETTRAESVEETKANKATTLAGYGITDGYTKAEGENFENSVNVKIETQQAKIDTFNGNEVVVVSDHTAVSNPVNNIIYREQGTDSYTDWMYQNSSWKLIATYSFPGADVTPTAGSTNWVTSDGIYQMIKDSSFNENLFEIKTESLSYTRYYSTTKEDGTYGTDGTYRHKVFYVADADYVEITANQNYSCLGGFLTTANAGQSGGIIPFVDGTSSMVLAEKGTTTIVKVPEGAVVMELYFGKYSEFPYMPVSVKTLRNKVRLAEESQKSVEKTILVFSANGYAPSTATDTATCLNNNTYRAFMFRCKKGEKYCIWITGKANYTDFFCYAPSLLHYSMPWPNISGAIKNNNGSATICTTITADRDGFIMMYQSGGSPSMSVIRIAADNTMNRLDELDDYKETLQMGFSALSLTSIAGYIDGWGHYHTASSTYHAMIAVTPGQHVKIIANDTDYTLYSFLTSNVMPSNNVFAPIVEGIAPTVVGAGKEVVVEVPEGALYIDISLGSNNARKPQFVGIESDELTQPRAGGKELMRGGGVYEYAHEVVELIGGDSSVVSDLDFADENGNIVVAFRNGHIKTKNFDSTKTGKKGYVHETKLSYDVDCSMPYELYEEGVDSFSTINVKKTVILGKEYTDRAALYLPESYTASGTPTRLVMMGRAGGGTFTDANNYAKGDIDSPDATTLLNIVPFLLHLGYAVLALDGTPDGWATEMMAHASIKTGSNPFDAYVNGNYVAVRSARKAYDMVIDEYNIAKDGVFGYGYSQGGWMIWNIAELSGIPFLGLMLKSPVVYLGNYFNAYASNGTSFHGGTVVSDGGIEYPRWRYFMVRQYYGINPAEQEMSLEDFLAIPKQPERWCGYDPFIRNSQNIPTDEQVNAITSTNTSTDIQSIDMWRYCKFPIKIWIAKNDDVVNFKRQACIVKAIRNAGGWADIRMYNTGGHYLAPGNWNPLGSFTYKNKTYTLYPPTYEMALFLRKFGGNEISYDNN